MSSNRMLKNIDGNTFFVPMQEFDVFYHEGKGSGEGWGEGGCKGLGDNRDERQDNANYYLKPYSDDDEDYPNSHGRGYGGADGIGDLSDDIPQATDAGATNRWRKVF